MRLLAACSLGGSGHLQPLLPFLDAARANGDETLVVAPPALGGMVEETGHPFAVGGEPSEEVIAPIRERLPTAPASEASILGNRELFGRLAATAMLPAMETIVVDWRPDLVLRDPCEYASAIVAMRRNVAMAQVAIGLADVEWRSIAVAAPALEAHASGLVDALQHSPYLSRFPASMDPSRFVDTRRFRDASARERRPLADWWNGSSAPLVYVTFGTVLGHMSIAARVYTTMLEAVRELDARVLLTVGRRFDLACLGPIPGKVHVEAWVEQDDVLAEADVVVCHGGSGTTFGTLAAGTPLVVVPLFADQFVNGELVAASGAGLVVETARSHDGSRHPIGPDDAARVTEAIRSVRGDTSCRDSARRVADEMATAATARPLLDELFAEDRPGKKDA